MRTHPVIVCFCPAQCSPCCFNPALDAASGAGFLHCLIPRGQRTASMQGGQRCFAPGKLHMSERDGTVFLYGEARRGFGQTDHESAAALCRKHFGERYHIQFGLPPAVAALREQQRIHHRKETEAAVKVQALQRGASARKVHCSFSCAAFEWLGLVFRLARRLLHLFVVFSFSCVVGAANEATRGSGSTNPGCSAQAGCYRRSRG
mmetsp:Transcript_10766/g.24766  ORF Transcript_10766/g.24766 Transcript_10766/m.24766 type:complete len:205 (+) Transcript_10766:751-1365(+)